MLARLYQQNGNTALLEIVVNADISVKEHWDEDWNGSEIGHAIFLTVDENIYIRHIKEKNSIEGQIQMDLNNINSIPGEYIAKVVLGFSKNVDSSWREQTGVLASSKQRVIQESAQDRIWEQGHYRLFLSHKTENKTETAKLKKEIKKYGISCFVAHEDIHPTQEWQNEIENALFSMDAFVALMTENFHESLWTDQEVGVAMGRGVPIISVKLGRDPYGFIGKYQALKCTWDAAPFEIAKILIKHEKAKDSFIQSLNNCSSFSDGNDMAELLNYMDNINEAQAKSMIEAYNYNSQIRSSYGFNGKRPGSYGDGLSAHLKRLTGKDFSEQL